MTAETVGDDMSAKKGEIITLDENYIMITIPKNTYQLEIIATTTNENGETLKVKKYLNTEEIFEARKNFQDNIGDDWDATYIVTDKGRKWMEEMRKALGDV